VHLLGVGEISLARRVSQSSYGNSIVGTLRSSLGGKTWARRASLTSSGVMAAGRLQNLGTVLATLNLFAPRIV